MMELLETSVEELYGQFPASVSPYASEGFNELNKAKAEELKAYVLYDSKQKSRLGVLAGLRGGAWCVPYSAPFGEILYRKVQSFETCMDFVNKLRSNLSGEIRITLAPDLYDPIMLPRLKGAFAAHAFKFYNDYNYSYPLDRYNSFTEGLGSAARNHYNRSLRAGFCFYENADAARVYEVIRRNRAEHSYPLAMSLADLRATSEVITIDYHLLCLGDADVAAAVVYRLNSCVAQVIYWGDVAGYSAYRPMNLLAEKVVSFYRRAGFRTLDIGPSSSCGVPDVGLCSFKESLGCDLSFKPSFILNGK